MTMKQQFHAWLQANPQASPETMQSMAASFGLNWWQLMADAMGVIVAIEPLGVDPRFKGANTLAVQVTNTTSSAATLVPVPGVVVTF